MDWISVKDRLPEVYTWVLCRFIPEKKKSYTSACPKQFLVAYCYDGNEAARQVCKERRYEGLMPMYFCNPICECEPFLPQWNSGFEEITHWMPLPKGPDGLD